MFDRSTLHLQRLLLGAVSILAASCGGSDDFWSGDPINLPRTFQDATLGPNGNPAGSGSTYTVDEGVSGVFLTIRATDGEGDRISFTLERGAGTLGRDSALFQINSQTEELSYRVPPDYEDPGDANTDNIYDVLVQANTSDGFSTLVLNIVVRDVAEMTASGVVLVHDAKLSQGHIQSHFLDVDHDRLADFFILIDSVEDSGPVPFLVFGQSLAQDLDGVVGTAANSSELGAFVSKADQVFYQSNSFSTQIDSSPIHGVVNTRCSPADAGTTCTLVMSDGQDPIPLRGTRRLAALGDVDGDTFGDVAAELAGDDSDAILVLSGRHLSAWAAPGAAELSINSIVETQTPHLSRH